MDIRGIDHIGIAVEDRAAAEAWLARLGLNIDREEVVEDQGVTTYFVDLPNVKLELVAPLHDESPIARHLAKRGPGLHHLAFAVGNVEAALSEVQGNGVAAIDARPRPGVEGTRIAFLHPRDTGKVLSELVELPE